MKRLIATLLFLGLIAYPSLADCWFIVKDLPSYKTIEERQEYAALLLAEIEKIYIAIPELSPKEAKWLDIEMASDNIHRGLKALESNEGRLKKTKEIMGNLKNGLGAIHDKKYKDLKHEIMLWLAISHTLMHPTMADDLSSLVQAKTIVVNSNHKYSDPDLMDLKADIIAREIIQNIVLPYLNVR